MSLHNIVHCESLRMAGNAMDQAIEEHFRTHHFFAIGETTAERIKIQHGAAVPIDADAIVDVKGLNIRTGCPAILRVAAGEIHDALEPILSQIVEAIRRTIEGLPPELAGDILGEGGAMVGGGALLRGWSGRLRDALGLPIRIDDDPLMAVTRGLIRILEDRDRYADLILNSEYQPALAG